MQVPAGAGLPVAAEQSQALHLEPQAGEAQEADEVVPLGRLKVGRLKVGRRRVEASRI